MLELRKMRHVVTLAKLRSYVRSADELSITQSALTRSIQAAEAQLGLRLFERNKSGLLLTVAGQRFVVEAEKLLRDASALHDAMRWIKAGDAGDVSLGFGPLAATAILPSLLTEMLSEVPAICVQVAIEAPDKLLTLLASDKIEFAILSSSVLGLGQQHNVSNLGSLPLGLLARSGHPLSGRRITETDARAFPMIGSAAVEGSLTQLHDAKFAIACENYDILRKVALNSDALWFSSPCAAQEECSSGLLVAIDCPELFGIDYDLVLVSRKGRTLSPAAETTCRRISAAITLHNDHLGR